MSYDINLDLIVKAFQDFNQEKNISTLVCDAHAHDPERVGRVLHSHGYTNLDGLVPKHKQSSDSCFHKVIPLESSSFDCRLEPLKQGYEIILLVDVFNGVDAVPLSCLEQLLTLTASGGFLCWTMPNLARMAQLDPQQFGAGEFDRFIAKLCDKCKWLSVLGYPRVIPNYAKDAEGNTIEGVFFAMQVV